MGAGLAGLACARELAGRGLAVTVFDKGRTPGGRLGARAAPANAFDLGAQYFTLRDERFVRQAPLDVGALFDDRARAGLGGDWACGGRVEGAYLSGLALAGRVLGAAPGGPPRDGGPDGNGGPGAPPGAGPGDDGDPGAPRAR